MGAAPAPAEGDGVNILIIVGQMYALILGVYPPKQCAELVLQINQTQELRTTVHAYCMPKDGERK